jgi:hypothetical protein
MPTYTERAPSNYTAKFVNLDTEYKLTDKETGEELTRWRWVWQEVGDPTTAGVLDTITSTSFRARTNGLKLFTGMLGRAPKDGDNTDDLIGQVFEVTYGPNQNGRYTVTAAVPARTGAQKAEAQHAIQEGDEDPTDLPF